MAYLKITRYGCRPLGHGPLVIGGESVLAWEHIATGKVVFTCPDLPGFGWRVKGEGEARFSSSLRAIARRLDRQQLEAPGDPA